MRRRCGGDRVFRCVKWVNRRRGRVVPILTYEWGAGRGIITAVVYFTWTRSTNEDESQEDLLLMIYHRQCVRSRWSWVRVRVLSTRVSRYACRYEGTCASRQDFDYSWNANIWSCFTRSCTRCKNIWTVLIRVRLKYLNFRLHYWILIGAVCWSNTWSNYKKYPGVFQYRTWNYRFSNCTPWE